MHMDYSLNSLKGGYIRDYIGDYHRVTKGDTRSLDSSSHGHALPFFPSSHNTTCCNLHGFLESATVQVFEGEVSTDDPYTLPSKDP